MTPPSRAEIDALFARALDRPAAERSEFVAEACAGDAALMAEVTELLRFADEPAVALESSPLGRAALVRELVDGIEARDERAGPGRRIGRWRLTRELGRGGMGTVYLAERVGGDFEQRAAVKLLSFGDRSDEAIHRFERERQILATLEHPNIARLIDGGYSDDGQPYLAMEYVVGQRIDDYCREQRLSLDERIELFIGVAQAAQAAHRSLVVHRDLKPSNILVTGDGAPKLLDFGIAKLIEPSRNGQAPTQTLARALTPSYASPEQVRGEPMTTASDIYQLGLLLFELVTGERAQRVEGSVPSAIEREVCEKETPRPSSVVAGSPDEHRVASPRALRGDLDTIVLKALHKEPERRYGSASELVADLERYRRGFPVEARPDTFWYRASRFVRRNRVFAAAAGLIFVLLLGYALTITIQQRRIRAEAERAREAIAFVNEMLGGSELGQLGSGERTALEIIDRGARLATSELSGQPNLQAEILTDFGHVYMKIGRYDRAIAGLERALEIRSRDLPPADPRTAETALLLGMNLHYSSRLHEALSPLREARSGYLAAYGAGHPASCDALTHLGDLLHTRGELRAAETELRTAFNECGGAMALRDLANVLRDRGDLDEALRSYRTALVELEPTDLGQVALTYQYLGYALTLAGDLGGARSALESWAEIASAQWGTDHPVVASGLRNQGRLARAEGDLAAAERYARRADSMVRRWLGGGHHMVPRTIVDLAAVALAQGRASAALETAQDALAHYERLKLPDHPMALEARQIAAAARLELGNPALAASELREVIRRQRALFVENDVREGVSHALLAAALLRGGEAVEARSHRELAATALGSPPRAAVLYCRTYGPVVSEYVPETCGL